MKNIVIYSTCQGNGIKNYIQYYFPKSNITVIHNYQLVLKSNGNELQDFRNLLQKTNIFIYQEMPGKWGLYSTDLSVEDNLLNYISNDCIKITIPYVYADWFWCIAKIPSRDTTVNFDTISNNSIGPKYINKEIIMNLKKSNYELDTILKLYDDNKLDFKYEQRKIEGINILKSKETTCDVKISDFILKNYKKYKLFYMPSHPTHIILKEMSKQILEKLNINYNNFDTLFKNNNYNLGTEIPSSKYDKNHHNYEFKIKCKDKKIKEIIVEIYNNI